MSHSAWQRWVPGIAAARELRRSQLRGDIVAGVAVTALLIPHGMAYAELAGLPPVTGLYTTVLALVAYAAFGPSRVLLLGPDSSLAPLIAAAIVLVGADGDPGRAVATAGILALLTGLVCVIAGLIGLGTLAELLSKPVRIGYLNGLAVVIVVSQLPKLFGFSSDADTTVGEARDFVQGLGDGLTNGTALVVGTACVAVIVGVERLWPRAPAVLLAVAGATVTVAVFELADRGVEVVGSIPSGVPAPSWPRIDAADLPTLAAAAVGIAFLTLSDTSALSRSFAARAGQRVDPNREIIGLGAANLATGLFQGFPVSASTTRTTVAHVSGGRSQLVGVVGAALVAALLVAGTDIVQDLPSTALAALVLVAAGRLVDVATLRWLLSVRRSEFLLSISTTLGVVVAGVLEGIVIAVGLSLVNFLRRAWRPHDAILGRVEQRKGYHDVLRNPAARQIPGLLVYRFDAPLFFANADYFARRLRLGMEMAPAGVQWIVVAAEPMTDIDTTGAEVLSELIDELSGSGVTLAFAELKGPTRDRLRHYGLYDRIGDDRFFSTVGTSISAYLEATGVEWVDWTDRSPAGPGDDESGE